MDRRVFVGFAKGSQQPVYLPGTGLRRADDLMSRLGPQPLRFRLLENGAFKFPAIIRAILVNPTDAIVPGSARLLKSPGANGQTECTKFCKVFTRLQSYAAENHAVAAQAATLA